MSAPRSRLLRRHEPPTGYPTRALVAYFDLMVDNLLLQSETFSSAAWTKIRSYIAANCAADPVSGQFTVDKLVEDGTAENYRLVRQLINLSAPFVCQVRAKAVGRTWLMLYAAGNTAQAYFNLTTGTPGAKSAGITTAMFDAGGGMWDCVMYVPTGAPATNMECYLAEDNSDATYSGLGHQGTAVAGGTTTMAVLAAEASAVDDVYNGTDTLVFSDAPTVWHTVTGYVGATKQATFTPARATVPDGTTYTVGPGILIARAQLNPGTSLRDYVATTDLQSLGSLYGKSPTLQRGATSGAEASDGSYGASGWVAVTDDYLLGSALADGTMAGQFSLPIVGKFNGTVGTVVSIAASAVTTHYQRVAYNGAGQVRIGTKAGAGAETFSSDLAVDAASILALHFWSDGTTLTLMNQATGLSVTLASQAPTGACRIGIGCTAGSTVANIADAATLPLVALHNAALSTGPWTRAYRSLKARGARKGVVIL